MWNLAIALLNSYVGFFKIQIELTFFVQWHRQLALMGFFSKSSIFFSLLRIPVLFFFVLQIGPEAECTKCKTPRAFFIRVKTTEILSLFPSPSLRKKVHLRHGKFPPSFRLSISFCPRRKCKKTEEGLITKRAQKKLLVRRCALAMEIILSRATPVYLRCEIYAMIAHAPSTQSDINKYVSLFHCALHEGRDDKDLRRN